MSAEPFLTTYILEADRTQVTIEMLSEILNSIVTFIFVYFLKMDVLAHSIAQLLSSFFKIFLSIKSLKLNDSNGENSVVAVLREFSGINNIIKQFKNNEYLLFVSKQSAFSVIPKIEFDLSHFPSRFLLMSAFFLSQLINCFCSVCVFARFLSFLL